MFQNFILKARVTPSEEISSGIMTLTVACIAILLRNAPERMVP